MERHDKFLVGEVSPYAAIFRMLRRVTTRLNTRKIRRYPLGLQSGFKNRRGKGKNMHTSDDQQ